MKRIVALLLIVASGSVFAQLVPGMEIGAGIAVKHSEGFYVPRYTISGLNLFRGLGAYTTYEHRGNVTFSDDLNGDGVYQRYTFGPTFSLNKNLYTFAGLSPIGPYGLSKSFGKVRKEVGIGLIFNPVTLRLGYSNWVGTTVGVHYRINLPKRSSVSKRKKWNGDLTSTELIKEVVVDTLVVFDTVEVTVDQPNIGPNVPLDKLDELEPGTILCTIYFDFDSYVPNPASKICLEQIADALKNFPDIELEVVGHTDPIGSESVNMRIGLQRAKKVEEFIQTTFGFPLDQMETISKGESELISSDNSINRRVEVRTK